MNKDKEQGDLFEAYLRRFGEPFPAVEFSSGQWSPLIREALRKGKPVGAIYRVELNEVV